MSRLTKYEVALLTPPNVTIRRCTTLNPATLIPEPIDDETLYFEHNCFELMDAETKPLANVQETPMSGADLELYVDGSRYYLDGKPHTGYAIVSQNEVLKGEALSPRMSAQEAELKALAEACIIAENRIANVFTDSRYAFGICHDYGPIWKSRKFIGSSGKPIKNAEAVAQLLRALELPKQVAIVKVQAHTKECTKEAEGNRRADAAAKAAALLPLPVETYTVQVSGSVDLDLLQSLQDQASAPDRKEWTKRSAKQGKDGLWRADGKYCLPRSLYSMMCTLSHGPTHQSKDAMFHSRSFLFTRHAQPQPWGLGNDTKTHKKKLGSTIRRALPNPTDNTYVSEGGRKTHLDPRLTLQEVPQELNQNGLWEVFLFPCVYITCVIPRKRRCPNTNRVGG
ncbi:uncharacterized protein [Phyllobates terribilis]|uniref:uncharacterized protein n=1 Tax=Phyllobates terribilis TaxID=111132 RepID=UPI003CCA6E46